MNNTMGKDATGAGHDLVSDKTVEKRLTQTPATRKKLEVMAEYFEDGLVDKKDNKRYTLFKLKHYNKVFKKYISNISLRSLKSELNIARKRLYNKFKAEV